LTEATHLIKVWFLDNFPKNWTKEMIRAAMLERFGFLGDRLENIEIIPLNKEQEKIKKGTDDEIEDKYE
jgi:hypothetical protein